MSGKPRKWVSPGYFGRGKFEEWRRVLEDVPAALKAPGHFFSLTLVTHTSQVISGLRDMAARGTTSCCWGKSRGQNLGERHHIASGTSTLESLVHKVVQCLEGS